MYIAGLIYEKIGGRRLKTSKGYRQDTQGTKLKELKKQFRAHTYWLLVSRSSLPYCIPTCTSVVLPPRCRHRMTFRHLWKKIRWRSRHLLFYRSPIVSVEKYLFSRLVIIILLRRYYNFFLSCLLDPKSVLWKSANGHIMQTILFFY